MDSILGIHFDTFIDKGMWGILTLFLIIIGKLWVIPSISKVLENRLNMRVQLMEKLDAIVSTLNESKKSQNEAISSFTSEINTAHTDRQRIDHKLDVLLGEHVGTLDESLAINMFALIIYKEHLVALCFYNLRVANNGLETARHTILSRYSRKAEEVANDALNQLGNYYHNNQKLSYFFGNYAIVYYGNLFNDLFNAQEKIYKIPEERYSLEDIEDALDRNASRLITAFRKWLKDKSYTYEIASNSVNFELWQDMVEL